MAKGHGVNGVNGHASGNEKKGERVLCTTEIGLVCSSRKDGPKHKEGRAAADGAVEAEGCAGERDEDVGGSDRERSRLGDGWSRRGTRLDVLSLSLLFAFVETCFPTPLSS
jgi:hypothetical protein